MKTEPITVDNVSHTLPRWLSRTMDHGGAILGLIGMGAAGFAIFDLLLLQLGGRVVLREETFELAMLVRPAICFFGGTVLFFTAFCLNHVFVEKESGDWTHAANRAINSHAASAQKHGFNTSCYIESESYVDRVLIDRKNSQVMAYIWAPRGRKGDDLTVTTAAYEEIKEVSVKSEPEESNLQLEGSLTYSLGGYVLGGFEGLVVGSLVDSLIEGVKGPKKIYFLLDVTFKLADGSMLTFKGVNSGFGVTSENIGEFRLFAKRMFGVQERYLHAVSEHFKDKLSA